MQAAERANDVVAGPQVQVIGVRQDDLRVHRAEILGVERLHGRQRANWHEHRSFHRATRRAE